MDYPCSDPPAPFDAAYMLHFYFAMILLTAWPMGFNALILPDMASELGSIFFRRSVILLYVVSVAAIFAASAVMVLQPVFAIHNNLDRPIANVLLGVFVVHVII